ncbi:hypothetical protein PGT21_036854 [Puccinia graminis f. sp. tritici]|uniref:Uncharacterized protein n=2 Tax=Puccinia graminis f. sp. tritici TaxID=56615 RepID=A0A5B0QQE9_PUCGR|nr:hypothetical protein PGT21_036854 [Puccinia graminis f. sp. tritici]KAA1121909.1 hypothetical protein PGTUg99_035325 [Puccinia graminis f. sp. tritici]KAA1126260.1 hypothetical protein PGTUg99_021582 [Puccinia graminis f. sp. tritici]
MTSSSISVLVSTFHPFPTLSFSLPKTTPTSKLPSILNPVLALPDQSLSTSNGKSIDINTKGTLSSLLSQDAQAGFLLFRLVPKVLGGKGGFGSQLRAAGGRMSSQKTQNNDSCRDLSGRRLSTIKEAQKLAAAIAAEPERQLAKRKEAEEKLEGLKKEIERLDSLVNGTDEMNLKKRRLNDSHLLTQSKEGIEKVRNATSLAMLKKKKKLQQERKKAAEKPTLSNSVIVEEEDKESEAPAIASAESQPSTTVAASPPNEPQPPVTETSSLSNLEEPAQLSSQPPATQSSSPPKAKEVPAKSTK